MFSVILFALSYPTILAFMSFVAIYCYYRVTNKEANGVTDIQRIPGPRNKYPIIGNIDLFRIKGVPLNQCKIFEFNSILGYFLVIIN